MSIWERPSNLTKYFNPTWDRIEAISKLLNVPTELISPTGSRHIENPNKITTDDDYLINVSLTDPSIKDYANQLVSQGWIDCLYSPDGMPTERYAQEGIAGNIWGAFRNGEVNIILYKDSYLYDMSVVATLLCQKLNVKDKERRIRIFRWFKFNCQILPIDLELPKFIPAPFDLGDL